MSDETLEKLEELCESALMAYSETQPDDETRMARMIAPISEMADFLKGSKTGAQMRAYPDLLSEAERKQILADAEWLWKRLEANDIGGFSGINRPFYILHAFKEVIEKYGRRDVGLSWSKNDLDAAKALSQEETK